MFRTPFAVLFILASLAVISWGFYLFLEEKKPNQDIFSPVNSNAIAILHMKKAESFHQELAHNSLIWKELLNYSNVNSIHNRLLYFDSIAHTNPFFEKEILEREVLIAFYRNEHSTEWVLHIPIEGIAQEVLNQFKHSGIEYHVEQLEEVGFVKIESANLYLLFQHEFLYVASNPISIKTVLDKKKKENAIKLNELRQLASRDSPANFYFKSQLISYSANHMMKNETPSFLRNKLAEWTMLDLSTKFDEISLSGFSQTDSNSFLQRFKNQGSIKWKAQNFLPENVAAFLSFSITDQYDLIGNENYEEHRYDWLGDESALAYWPQRNGQVEKVVLLKVADSLELMSFMQDSFSGEQLWMDTSLLNALFKDVQTFHSTLNYFIEKDYLILAEENSTLKKLESRIRQDKTLGQSTRFKDFEENISARSNFIYFSNLSYAAPHLKSNVQDSLSEWIEDLDPLMQRISGIAFQSSWLDDNCFIMLHAEFNPLEKDEDGAIWELVLDAPVRKEANLVRNHYTGSWEIFTQDLLNQIYLISPDGTILWKREIDEAIVGEVMQIDILKNDKLQLAFSTTSQIHVIDRKGRDVEGFPIKVNSGCSSPLAIFDYENDRNYRFFIADKQGSIRVFNETGKAVKGWNYKPTGQYEITELEHLRVGKKDYVLARRNDGRILLLNRKGAVRYKNDLLVPNNNYAEVFLGKDIKMSGLRYFDDSGQFLSETFSGVRTIHFELPVPSKIKWFSDILDDDGQKELLIYTPEEIWLKELDGTDIKYFRPTEGKIESIKTYHFPKGQILLGLKYDDFEEVVLTSMNGEMIQDYSANTSIRIADLTSKGTYSAIMADSEGILFNFEVGTP